MLDDLDRYELKVTGLPAGKYCLSINGEAAGDVTSGELAKGHNLATCPGPIAKQVQQVLSLVFKKNDVYFTRWRQVQLGRGPEGRLRELDKQISDLEAEINAARTPKQHHFELKAT